MLLDNHTYACSVWSSARSAAEVGCWASSIILLAPENSYQHSVPIFQMAIEPSGLIFSVRCISATPRITQHSHPHSHPHPQWWYEQRYDQ